MSCAPFETLCWGQPLWQTPNQRQCLAFSCPARSPRTKCSRALPCRISDRDERRILPNVCLLRSKGRVQGTAAPSASKRIIPRHVRRNSRLTARAQKKAKGVLKCGNPDPGDATFNPCVEQAGHKVGERSRTDWTTFLRGHSEVGVDVVVNNTKGAKTGQRTHAQIQCSKE